jgi:hypothetical protein
VDRLIVQVAGTWSAASRETADNYLCNILYDPDIAWLRLPQAVAGQHVSVRSRSGTHCTFKEIKGSVRRERGGAAGSIKLAFTCNPTRTLHHLLARSGDLDGFADVISLMSDTDFFALAPASDIPLALNRRDNWLPDIDRARSLLGPNVFSTFLPIFVQQLQRFAMRLVRPALGDTMTVEGAATVAASEDVRASLDWAHLKVPQIESYIERYHGTAIIAVRTAAQNVLTAYPDVDVTRYDKIVGLQRDIDRFSIKIKPRDGRQVSVYAKWQDRLRFEVRRVTVGRYPRSAPIDTPEARLLQIIEHERTHAAVEMDWQYLGMMFDQPETAYLGDLINFVARVSDICAEAGLPARPIMTALVGEGGYTETSSGVPPEVTRLLKASALIRQVRVRNYRARGAAVRYSLAPPYTDLRHAMLAALDPMVD